MTSKILFSLFSLSNLYALANKFRLLLIEKFPNNPMITAVLAQLESSMKIANKAINDSKRNPLTKTVREADQKRDDLYVSLKNHVIAGTRRTKPEYRDACLELLPIFEQNNLLLPYLGDQEETAAIDSLLSDLNNEEAQSHLATINALEWMQELDEANKEFVLTSKSRSNAKVSDETQTDKAAFQKLKTSLGFVCSALDAILAMQEPKEISSIVATANQYIKEANTVARLSGKRPGDKGDDKGNDKE